MSSPAELKAQILKLTRDYSALMHKGQRPGDDAAHAPWSPGQTIPYAGRVFDEDEVEAAVGATLDFWLTLGPEGEAFEKELAALLGVKHSLLVNSGSSANLVAFATLTTHKLPSHKRLQPGDEVITVAAGFPTTVSPILQLGAIPVFLDNDPITGNLRPEQLDSAFVPGKTKAVMIAHALGNPFDVGAVLEFCRKNDLWLIEDNCDALGCTYSLPVARAKALGLDHLIKRAEQLLNDECSLSGSGNNPATGNQQSRIPFVKNGILTAYTGTFGDISTQSFYPPHHLTMGEGGAVNIISKPPLKTYAESFRDWGRDCWCASGKDDTCNKRFGWQLGELPKGYDHKYIYSHLGYNLKPLDPQAAIGRQQLKKLPAFIEARKQNWETLRAGLDCVSDVLDFTLPAHAIRWLPPGERGSREQLLNDNCLLSGSTPGNSSTGNRATGEIIDFASCFEWDSSGCQVDTSWFGFMLIVRESAPFTRTDVARHLESTGIGNRMLFGGNLVRQPVFAQRKSWPTPGFRTVGDLTGADAIMNEVLFVGVYPGLTTAMIAHIAATIGKAIEKAATIGKAIEG